ncbi:MAG: hypothetical protein LC122_12390 [Chitinophagales bacterium]|nr:hypothetical protein [Chitinophagales bacterium]
MNIIDKILDIKNKNTCHICGSSLVIEENEKTDNNPIIEKTLSCKKANRYWHYLLVLDLHKENLKNIISYIHISEDNFIFIDDGFKTKSFVFYTPNKAYCTEDMYDLFIDIEFDSLNYKLLKYIELM